ncbi:MAG: hypothetical protein ABR530_05820 [Pyrinomonadaceae bacterium]
MSTLKLIKTSLFILVLGIAVNAQVAESNPAKKWFVVSDDSVAKVQVADLALGERSGERAALVRITRGIAETYAETLTLFHCGRRQTAAQVTTVYRPDDGEPIEVKNPKAPFSRVRKGSSNEKILTFVCAAKIAT